MHLSMHYLPYSDLAIERSSSINTLLDITQIVWAYNNNNNNNKNNNNNNSSILSGMYEGVMLIIITICNERALDCGDELHIIHDIV